MAKYVRVKLPLGSPDGTLTLAQRIVNQHTVLGANSPLYGFVDMVAFETLRAAAAAMQKAGDDRRADAKASYGQASELCNIRRGRSSREPGYLIWYIMEIRDVLRVKYRGVEKQMEPFGFHVVITTTAARKNVRIKLPMSKPADLVELGKKIMAQHVHLGILSPLNGMVDMVKFSAMVTTISGLLGDWENADADAQASHQEALAMLGYDKGQTSDTRGTIYYDLLSIRDRLLQFYRGTEEHLEVFGFHVVVTSKLNGRKKKAVAS